MNSFTDRAEIREHQLAELKRLLAEVSRTNAFYRARIRQAGLGEGPDDIDAFIERMPLTTKQELIDDQHRHPPYGTNLTYPLTRYTRFNQTSATSGPPMRWLDTPQSWQWMLDNWRQVYAAAGVTAEDRIYFAFSFGPFLGFWTAFDSAAQLGCLCLPGGGFSSLGRLAAMRENGATVLCATPTYAMRLAEVAREEGEDLAQFDVRRIIVAGEPGGSVPAVREALQDKWPKATVFDHHGMTEVGPVSFQHPERPGASVVIESSYLAEIIDPESAEPVAPGEIGELVLTTLGRTGSPLIRYRTGDLVREDVGPSDSPNRAGMVLAGGILGRADDMVVVRGVNVYPGAVADVCAAIPEIAEHRVRVGRRGAMVELELEIESIDESADAGLLAERVQALMKSRLNLSVPVTVQPPGTLPRFEMKSRRWVQE